MTISKTFCPAKWDEILVNLSANYVYSCCRSVPVKIFKKEDIIHALDQQKTNLLNEVQDPSCNYCWQVENAGHKSRRHQYLESFDYSTLNKYQDNIAELKQIEVSLGNECNFQCIYCNPKFSSKWETDVKDNPYKIYSDKDFYSCDVKNKDNLENTVDWVKSIGSIDNLNLIGGEPLQNKYFDRVISSVNSKKLGFSSNFSFKKLSDIDKIIKLSEKYQEINAGISLDSTGNNAEFSRYGMDYDQLIRNITYFITNSPSNINITILSVMNTITIRDIKNTHDVINNFYNINPNIIWNINYCTDPKILTFNTLADELKPEILDELRSLKDKDYIKGVSGLEGAIKTSKFNKTLYNQMKHFLTEFSERKKITIPVDLKDD